MKDRNYFPFYFNWAELINEYIDVDKDEETARTPAVAIIRYATRGEIRDLGNRHLQRMFEACLTSGIDAAAKHYDNGSRGGRPSKLTMDDNALIARYRSDGQTAKQIAAHFEVSDDTIRRSDGWQNPQKYTQPQNQEEEEKEKEKRRRKICGKLSNVLRGGQNRTKPTGQNARTMPGPGRNRKKPGGRNLRNISGSGKNRTKP